MDKTIVFYFAAPDPLKYEVKVAGTTTVKRRDWDGDQLRPARPTLTASGPLYWFNPELLITRKVVVEL